MIITVTGTPGTGKTSVSEHLEPEVIDLTEFVKQRGLGEKGEEFQVNISEMLEELRTEVKAYEDIVVEGHLSHHLQADYCIVLRCNPEELEERLKERNYSDQKIQENVESETLDVILTEAVARQEKIIEVDTTDREPEEVAEEIEKRVRKDDTGYGDIDWSGYIS